MPRRYTKCSYGRCPPIARKKSDPPTRYLGLDLSLTSPGFAVIEVVNRQPRLVASDHVTTGTDESYAQRFGAVEAFALLFIRDNRPYDGVIRETLPTSRNPRLPQAIYGAWAAVDSALYRYGYEVTAEIGPTKVKRLLTGNGKAEKDAVADAVQQMVGRAEPFGKAEYDESDAAAVVLAWLIEQNLIDTEAI